MVISTILPPLVMINLWGIFKTDGYSQWVGLECISVLCAILLAFNFRNLIKTQTKIKKIVLGFSAFSFLVFILLIPLSAPEAATELSEFLSNSPNVVVRASDSAKPFLENVRPIFWRTALDAGRKAPWFGRGLGGFNHYMPESRPPQYHQRGISHNSTHAENEYFEWFAETGVFGVSAFLWILAIFVYSTAQSAYQFRKEPRFALLAFGILGPLAMWVANFFTVDMRMTENGTPLWFVIGLVAAVSQLLKKRVPVNRTSISISKLHDFRSLVFHRPTQL
ncbi:MAG: O-antigen ligase family protein [Candidatus Lindowbacteria bacterium]|nr:O-antigen ligase family protein [Candidatus Lindowbacteria bacterium]